MPKPAVTHFKTFLQRQTFMLLESLRNASWEKFRTSTRVCFIPRNLTFLKLNYTSLPSAKKKKKCIFLRTNIFNTVFLKKGWYLVYFSHPLQTLKVNWGILILTMRSFTWLTGRMTSLLLQEMQDWGHVLEALWFDA